MVTAPQRKFCLSVNYRPYLTFNEYIMLSNYNNKYMILIYLFIIKSWFVMSQMNKSSDNIDADKYSVAYVTTISMSVGKILSHGLVKNRLAACVNIIPHMISVYEWKGLINEDRGALLIVKTRTSQVDNVTEFVRENHPYEVCEVISLPIKNGNPPFLKWIGDMVPEN